VTTHVDCLADPASIYRILVVDDDVQIRRVLRAVLTRALPLLEIREASTFRTAEDFLTSERFDLVVTDLELSAGTGLDVVRCVKSMPACCPVVLFTGAGADQRVAAALQAGADAFVLKAPGNLWQLLARICGLLTLRNADGSCS
jgi:DNA-binding response OmpR family regulator